MDEWLGRGLYFFSFFFFSFSPSILSYPWIPLTVWGVLCFSCKPLQHMYQHGPDHASMLTSDFKFIFGLVHDLLQV